MNYYSNWITLFRHIVHHRPAFSNVSEFVVVNRKKDNYNPVCAQRLMSNFSILQLCLDFNSALFFLDSAVPRRRTSVLVWFEGHNISPCDVITSTVVSSCSRVTCLTGIRCSHEESAVHCPSWPPANKSTSLRFTFQNSVNELLLVWVSEFGCFCHPSRIPFGNSDEQ